LSKETSLRNFDEDAISFPRYMSQIVENVYLAMKNFMKNCWVWIPMRMTSIIY